MKLYSMISSVNTKKIQIFGINIYKKDIYINKTIRTYFYIFNIKETKTNKKYYLFNIKIFSVKKNIPKYILELKNEIQNILYNMQVLNQVQYYHNVFIKYKFAHKNQDIVIIACGPTLNKYIPIKGTINVGINGAVKFEHIDLDYLFLTDLLKGNPGLNDKIDAYNNGKCKKFYALLPQRRNEVVSQFDNAGRIPQKHFYNSGAIPFILEDIPNNKWAIELACEPFGDFGGSVFSALQFICYTYPKRIFLVGCDCTNGYFYKTSYNGNNSYKINSFRKFKKFVDEFYPDIEIYSINPIGLKGIFKDIYTDDAGRYTTEFGEVLNLEKELIL